MPEPLLARTILEPEASSDACEAEESLAALSLLSLATALKLTECGTPLSRLEPASAKRRGLINRLYSLESEPEDFRGTWWLSPTSGGPGIARAGGFRRATVSATGTSGTGELLGR